MDGYINGKLGKDKQVHMQKCVYIYMHIYARTLHYITLHYTTSHNIAIHCIALHYITLHHIKNIDR